MQGKDLRECITDNGKLSGAKLGKLLIANECQDFSMRKKGEVFDSFIPAGAFDSIAQDLPIEEKSTFALYLQLYLWIGSFHNIASGAGYKSQAGAYSAIALLKDLLFPEMVFSFIRSSMPAIMKKETYAHNLEEALDNKTMSVFAFVLEAIDSMCSCPNQEFLDIQKKYETTYATCPYLIERWQRFAGNKKKACFLEGGQGRIVDTLDPIERERKLFSSSATYKLNSSILKGKVYCEGGDHIKAERRVREWENEKFAPAIKEWSFSNVVPTKLAILERRNLVFGSWTKLAWQSFLKEFPEIANLILNIVQDSDHFLYGMLRIAFADSDRGHKKNLPFRSLYDSSVFGLRQELERLATKDDNFFPEQSENGIAFWKFGPAKAIDIRRLRNSCFYERNLDKAVALEEERKTLSDSLKNSRDFIVQGGLCVSGYNAIVQIASKVFELPELKTFALDVESSNQNLAYLNGLFYSIYCTLVEGNDPEREEKLELLRSLFKPIEESELAANSRQVNLARKLIKENPLQAFALNSPKEIATLLHLEGIARFHCDNV